MIHFAPRPTRERDGYLCDECGDPIHFDKPQGAEIQAGRVLCGRCVHKKKNENQLPLL